MKKDKSLSKKSIDIESEFIGKPVGPRKQKEKRPDLTDEIHKFMKEPITLNSLKWIILRLVGLASITFYDKSTIDIYQIHESFYVIKIQEKKRQFPIIFYIGPHLMCELDWISVHELDKSFLRGDLSHTIRNWLAKNPAQVHILP